MALSQIHGTEVLVCSVSDIGNPRKQRFTVEGRDIFIVRLKEGFYALDSFCYHAGGPLYNGDIEELGGRHCVVCPWHSYKVCVDTGENWYQSVDPHNPGKPSQWRAGKVTQRTHKVNVRDGKIYVTLSSHDKVLDSDMYNNRKSGEC